MSSLIESAGPSYPSSPPPAAETRLRDWWNAIRRNRWLILGITAAVVAGTGLALFLLRPMYQGEATVLLTEQQSSPNLVGELAALRGLGVLGGVGQGSIQTEKAVLESRRIAEEVVDSLDLHVQLLEPRQPRVTVLQQIDAPRSATRGVYEFTLQGDGRYAVEANRDDGTQAVGGAAEIGRPVTLGNVTLVLDPGLKTNPPKRIRVAVLPFQDAVEGVRKDLIVTRPEREAQILGIQYRSPDPVLAATVPNAVTELFVEYKTQTNRSDSRSYGGFLGEQAARYEQELEDAEMALRNFREANQIVSPENQVAEEVSRYVELKAKQDELEAQRESLSKLLATARSDAPRPGGTSPYRQIAAYPIFLMSSAAQSMLQSLIELENQRAQLLVRRTEQSIDVQGIDRRIEELERQLHETATTYLRGVETELAALNTALARFDRQLETVPAKEFEYVRLARRQKLLEQIYMLVETKLKDTEMKEASTSDDVRVLDAALVPERPVFPRPALSLGLALVFGLVLGVTATLARETFSTKVRTSADVISASGGLPVLGIIPTIDRKIARNGARNRLRSAGVSSGAARALLADPLVMRSQPQSAASEAYRSLRTSIAFGTQADAPRVLVITSAMPAEGKSTSAANLALSLAQQGVRTLLIDADLRHGTLRDFLDAPQEFGLADVLLETMSLQQAAQEVRTPRSETPLYFLGSGTLPPNPAELLGSPQMRRFLQDAREQYDVIILDAPPLNLVTDAAVLGIEADAAILVARAGVTDKRALEHAAAQLRRLGVTVVGVVLNGVDEGEFGPTYYRADVIPAGDEANRRT